ncbi:type II toxin-antitoxin system VapC family toxin [Roseivirga sp.]|uniref:type II toxin-antitoxin system VapC family toxin n=1 Tax=Roseivirga sp. TaxID=1964215 RepID=UPI003B5269D8
MRIFIDANVLVSVLNKEYPLFTHSSRVLSLAGQDGFELYSSSLCLAIGFYFSSKKSGAKLARKKIELLSNYLSIAPIHDSAVRAAINNPKVVDLEDGFQNYAAVDADCSCIVSENGADFYFSDLEILSSEGFLSKYVFKK